MAQASIANLHCQQAERVKQLIGEISSAARQQIAGARQNGDAVSQIDTVTRQNAALVEEGAAASESLKLQAVLLSSVVRKFIFATASS